MAYLGVYPDTGHGTAEEPHNAMIQRYARGGLSRTGQHGAVQAMGVPRDQLPTWDDIQILPAQLHRFALLDKQAVGTDVVIGPNARKPLTLAIPLAIPLLVSDMSFGALSLSAKVALAQGTELVSPRIAEVRGLKPGEAAISPTRFPDWTELSQIRDFADEVRQRIGGIPVGYKLSAQHIEKDIDAVLAISVDYIIVDGRGGGAGAAPLIFRDNISVPTIPALARARRHLDKSGCGDVTLVVEKSAQQLANVSPHRSS